jgi:hypothetical protein
VQRSVCAERTAMTPLPMPSDGLLPDDETTDTGN